MEWKMPEYREPELAALPKTDARFMRATSDGVAPEGFHATSIYPEYVRAGGVWRLVPESRMDCAVVREADTFAVVEPRRLKKGDEVLIGRTERGEEGIFLYADAFCGEGMRTDPFAFRTGRSRETCYSEEYDALYALLRHERAHGTIAWVMGPACAFDRDAREAFAKLARGGYVHALLAGNALATHDLEAGVYGTGLGQDIYTRKLAHGGHYHHLDILNSVRRAGSIENFLREGNVRDGIVKACVEEGIPMVLAGSIRDDGPLPEVYANVYEAQDAMRSVCSRATTLICMATALHTIAAGNMFPSYRVAEGKVRPTYFYSVDTSEFALNKLGDRGSLAVRTIVANVQDFVVNLERNLIKV